MNGFEESKAVTDRVLKGRGAHTYKSSAIHEEEKGTP